MTEEGSWRSSLWRGALVPSLITMVISIPVGFLVRESAGLAASLLASATVIIFFSVHLIVARISRSLDPASTMLVAMLSYFLKVALMAIFLILVTRLTAPESIDRPTFAVVSLALTFSWLAGEIRAFLRLRPGLDSRQ